MIIWKGNGIMLLFFWGFGAFVFGLSGFASSAWLYSKTGCPWVMHLMTILAATGGALGMWFCARTFCKTKSIRGLDWETGRPALIVRSHSLYFIPASVWVVLAWLAVIAVGAFEFFGPHEKKGFLSERQSADLNQTLHKAPSDGMPNEDSGTTKSVDAHLPVENLSSPQPSLVSEAPLMPAQSSPSAKKVEINAATSLLPTPVREWRDKEGKPLRASLLRFISTTKETAEFQRSDGLVFQISVSRFSEDDQNFIKDIATKVP